MTSCQRQTAGSHHHSYRPLSYSNLSHFLVFKLFTASPVPRTCASNVKKNMPLLLLEKKDQKSLFVERVQRGGTKDILMATY